MCVNISQHVCQEGVFRVEVVALFIFVLLSAVLILIRDGRGGLVLVQDSWRPDLQWTSEVGSPLTAEGIDGRAVEWSLLETSILTGFGSRDLLVGGLRGSDGPESQAVLANQDWVGNAYQLFQEGTLGQTV